MNTELVQRLIYPFYERLTDRRVRSKLRDFERMQWLTYREIETLQRERLRRLLVHAYQNVPFYRHRMEELSCSPEECIKPEHFRQLPLLTKDDILSHREELVARNFPPSELKLNATGGSTGHMLSFYNDRTSLDYRSAVTIRGDRWAGLDIGTPHARLWGAPLEINVQKRFVNWLANRILNRLWLDCFHLSEQILADYVQRLRRFRPHVLISYATALITMAQFLEANNVQDIRLHSVISSAETLFDEQRRQIEAAFGCKVFNRYGCREIGPIAMECERGEMHINADYVLVEVLKEAGQPAEQGEIGEIVVTSLFNYGMPFIRYRIGDVGVAAEQVPCPCGRGFPLIERVMGRVSDMLVNAKGELFHGEYFTHLFYNCPDIQQFQVIQPQPTCLIIRIVPTRNNDDLSPLLQIIEEKIRDFVGPIGVQWQIVDDIPPLESGKRRFTISYVSTRFTESKGVSRSHRD